MPTTFSMTNFWNSWLNFFWPNDYFGSYWSDNLTLTQPYNTVWLYSGDDFLHAKAKITTVFSGSGHDTLYLEEGADRVWTSTGNDKITTFKAIRDLDGDWGYDQLIYKFDQSELDISTQRDALVFSHKITGETTTLRGIEWVEFNDSSSSTHDLTLKYSTPMNLLVQDGTRGFIVNDPDPTVSVVWDRVVQEAIINSDVTMGPTIAARAYAMVHTAIYDAWASFDRTAIRVSADAEGDNAHLESLINYNPVTEAHIEKAMSYAAYTVLSDLFPDQVQLFKQVMTKRYGYSAQDDGSLAATVGLDAAHDMLASRMNDGANQANAYASTVDYNPINTDSGNVQIIDRWTPEHVLNADADQRFLTPHWGQVAGFAIPKNIDGSNDLSSLTPVAPEYFFEAAYANSTLNMADKTITLSAALELGGVSYAAGDTIAVSKALIGTVINQAFIAQAEQVVEISANLTDKQKVIAEVWEDGAGTSFPPGNAQTFAQLVSVRDHHSTADDAKLFMAMGNAQLDASIAAWNSKFLYDYARPIRVIRNLGELELIGEEGVDEVTGETGYVVRAWAGVDPVTGDSLGVKNVLAANWVTYQQPGSDPSPPFAEYVSGHSTFSAAGAEILKLYTGSDQLGASLTIASGASRFEPGTPHDDITLYWATFTDSANQSGISRLYGGIHFMDGNVNGLALGRDVGANAFDLAQSYFDGTADDFLFV